MRLLTMVLIAFYSLSAYGIGLQKFENYKNNNALLESDVQRLKEIVSLDNDKFYKDLLDQYNYLLAKYEILNSRLSLVKFSEDAGTSGWSNVKRISRNLAVVCEKGDVDQTACKDGIERLKTFVIASNIEGSSKESIITFLEEYMLEVQTVGTFNSAFINKFDQNSELVNIKKFNQKNGPPIIINIKPLEQQVAKALKNSSNDLQNAPLQRAVVVNTPVKDIIKTNLERLNSVSPKDITLFVGSLCFFLLSALTVHLSRRKRQIKSFQGKVFKIANNNKVKVKIFGRTDLSGIKKPSFIEKRILDSFSLAKSVSNTAHIKFRIKNNILSIETLFFSKRSVQNFFDKESFAFQKSLESLKNNAEESGGELIFNNKFNHKGEITQTSYTVSLPRV